MDRLEEKLTEILLRIKRGYYITRFYDFYNVRQSSYTVHIVYTDGETVSIERLTEIQKELILNFLIGVTR